MLVKGEIRVSEGQWDYICEVMTDCRMGEIQMSLKNSINYIICNNHRSMFKKIIKEEINFDVVEAYFRSDFKYFLDSIPCVILEEEQLSDLDGSISLYHPASKNDRSFLKSRMEMMDVTGYNLQIISVGSYFAIRSGKIPEKFKAEKNMQARCTKMTETHALASTGKAYLPAGITNGKNEALLPIPPRAYMSAIAKNTPVTILYKL